MVTAGSSGRECSYSHDISGELFDDIAGETWSCPHEYTDSSDYCPVHRSSASAQEVRSFITNACERDDAGRAETQFFGAECSALELGHTVLDDSSLFPVDFRDAIFGGVSMKKVGSNGRSHSPGRRYEDRSTVSKQYSSKSLTYTVQSLIGTQPSNSHDLITGVRSVTLGLKRRRSTAPCCHEE